MRGDWLVSVENHTFLYPFAAKEYEDATKRCLKTSTSDKNHTKGYADIASAVENFISPHQAVSIGHASVRCPMQHGNENGWTVIGSQNLTCGRDRSGKPGSAKVHYRLNDEKSAPRKPPSREGRYLNRGAGFWQH